jgi:hypothetical protein
MSNACHVGNFTRGDHIRVRRFGLYWHHGVYIDDDRVIEFGGGTLVEKYRALIRPITLGDFERGSLSSKVCYPRRAFFGLRRMTEPLPPDEIARRAEYLGTCRTQGLYNLLASNCEHLAGWCVAGQEGFVSLQVLTWTIPPAIVWLAMFWTKGRAWGRRERFLHFPLVGLMFLVDFFQVRAESRWKNIIGGFHTSALSDDGFDERA